MFSSAWEYIQLALIFVTNLALFLIVFNDAEEKVNEHRLAREKEEQKQKEEMKIIKGHQSVVDEDDDLDQDKKDKLTLIKRIYDFLRSLYSMPV
jgi:hypothetical protein